MKYIKIGKSSANDIVISDVTVSSQHAIITLLDTKEVRIRDLNSTNGTYVNGKRITTETTITANDVIKMGNSTIDWVKHLNERKPPAPPVYPSADTSTVKQRKTIGSLPRNDIVIEHKDVSRSHAQLLEKVTGEIVITDSGSTNGTYVNGQKISVQVLRQGDRVLIANKYPLDWENVFGKEPKPQPKRLKKILIPAAAVAAAAIIICGLFIIKPWVIKEKPWSPEKIFASYKKTVVMIYAEYYYSVSAGNINYGNYVILDGELVEDDTNVIIGTGFFVSDDGKIVTNKHIAQPWEYNQSEIEQLKRVVQNHLKYEASKSSKNQIKYLPLVNEVKIEGRLASIGIILNDTHITSKRDIIPCQFIKADSNNEIDIALIQTNSKSLPVGTEIIVDLNTAIIDDSGIVVGNSVFTIGFPKGLTLANTSQGISANNQDGKITQIRGDYEFGHNIPIIGGASGSPVFNEYGKLVGVIHRGLVASQGYNMAVKAKHVATLVN